MHVYSRHGGDLLVAENSCDERTVQAQLRQVDPDLILTWEVDRASGRQVWNVHKVVTREQPAILILSWRENGAGDPLPLTASLVDEVKRLREVDTMKLIDAANARLRERAKKQARTDALDLAADHAPYVDRNRVQITTAEAKNPKPYWQRNQHLRGAS